MNIVDMVKRKQNRKQRTQQTPEVMLKEMPYGTETSCQSWWHYYFLFLSITLLIYCFNL